MGDATCFSGFSLISRDFFHSEVKLHACALWRKARLPQGSAGNGEELGRGGVFTARVKSS